MKARIEGGYQTKFGEAWNKGLEELILEAGKGALKEAGVKRKEIELVLVANMLGFRFDNQGHLGTLASDWLGIKAPGLRVEGACASGGLAVSQAVKLVEAGEYKKILVIGAEKMTDMETKEVTASLMGAASREERRAGLTFVGLYALLAQRYFYEFGAVKQDLAYVAVKNHKHASMNPKAQFPYEVDLKKAMGSFCIAEPLGLFDCSPITDGAAGVVVGTKGVEVLASEVAVDSLSLNNRESLVGLEASKKASSLAYKKAGVSSKEVDLAEVHDCFTIAEIMAVEDLGFCKKGEGYKKIREGEFDFKGRLPVNLSGGLKAGGHPVGATGVKQIVELIKQLNGKAGQRQVRGAKIGLAHNVGGSGGTAVVTILRGDL